MGNLYFYDKLSDEYSFIFDWAVRSKIRGGWMSKSCVTMEMSDDIERITGWECNQKLLSSYESLAFNGKMNYGKRGIIYDINHVSNNKIALRIKRSEKIEDILESGKKAPIE